MFKHVIFRSIFAKSILLTQHAVNQQYTKYIVWLITEIKLFD